MGFLSRLFGKKDNDSEWVETQEDFERRREREEERKERRERRELQQTPRAKSWREQQYGEQCYLKYQETINPPSGQDISHMPDEERRAYRARHIHPLSEEEQSTALSHWAEEMARRRY